VQARVLARSPMGDIATRPKSTRKRQIMVLSEDQVTTLLNALSGHWMRLPVLLSLTTGLRRGEICALRWSDIDFEANTLRVERQAVHIGPNVVITSPKYDCLCTISLSAGTVAALKEHKTRQIELRLRLGVGGKPDLICTLPTGEALKPGTLSQTFPKATRRCGLSVTFHTLRHTHCTPSKGRRARPRCL